MRLTCLGGAGEIGANSYFLEVGSLGLLLDAGMHPKREGAAALPRTEAVTGDVDNILITHAHLDHVGALPYVWKKFPRARIHMTHTAWRFAARMLRNSVNVMRRRAESAGEAGPLYDFDAVEDLADVVETHDLDTPVELGRGVSATFVSAGHIPGAAGILLHDGASHLPGVPRTLFYTGDTCASSQLLIPGARYPEGPLDVLLTESTYGGNLVADGIRREDVMREFSRAVARVVERGGVVLLPVFALGRAQELLFALWTLMRKGRLPGGVPLFLTGLARALTRLYDETRRDTPRTDPTLRLETLGAAVLEADEIAAGAPEGPAIVLASSGMLLPNTAANALARRVLARPEDAIFIVGYQDPESPGYRVQHSTPGALIDLGDGRAPVERRCDLARFHFRAHSTRGELVRAARRMKPRRAVLVHGDPASARSLGDELAREGAGAIVIPDPAVTTDLSRA